MTLQSFLKKIASRMEGLKERREQLGISAAELSRSIGRGLSYIGHVESGKFKPSADMVAKIERSLGWKSSGSTDTEESTLRKIWLSDYAPLRDERW